MLVFAIQTVCLSCFDSSYSDYLPASRLCHGNQVRVLGFDQQMLDFKLLHMYTIRSKFYLYLMSPCF